MDDEQVLDTAKVAYPSTLALFDRPVTDLGISDVQYIRYQPQGTPPHSGPIEFYLSGAGNLYCDWSKSYLSLRVRIVQADGTPLPATDPAEQKIPEISRCALVNNGGHSLFDQVDVYYSGKLVSSSQTGYAYNAYFHNLLNYGVEAKEGWLRSALWYTDTPGSFGDPDPFGGTNVGNRERQTWSEASREMEVWIPILADVLKGRQLLLNGVSVRLRFTPTTTPFRIMSAAENPAYRVDITEATLVVCRVECSPALQVAHQEVLQTGVRAQYRFLREDLRKYTLAAGTSSYCVDDAFNNKTPTKIILALVKSENMLGAYNRNPFQFDHHDLSSLNVTVDNRAVPAGMLTMDYARNHYMDAYLSLFRGTDKWLQDADNNITYEGYPGGNAVYVVCFDQDADCDLDVDEVFPPKRSNSVRLEFQFAKPLPNSVTVLCLAFYPQAYEIDQTRALFLN